MDAAMPCAAAFSAHSRACAVVGLAMVAVGQDPGQHVLRVGLALLGRARVPLLGDGAVGRAVLAVEVEVAEQALAERVAGLGGERQPVRGEVDVARHAPAVDEAAADLGLGARHAGMAELDPDAERRVVVARGPRQRPPRPCAPPRRRRSSRRSAPARSYAGTCAASGLARRACSCASWARNPASSSRQRRSRISAPSLT